MPKKTKTKRNEHLEVVASIDEASASESAPVVELPEDGTFARGEVVTGDLEAGAEASEAAPVDAASLDEEAPLGDEAMLEGAGALDEGDAPGLVKAPPISISRAHLKSVVESLVFVADSPLSAVQIGRAAHAKKAEIEELLEELREEYRGRGIELAEVGGGWQLRTPAVNAPFVRSLVSARPVRLTRAQLETLAIISYRQPVTRPEVDEIRGVDSGSALKILLDRNLVRILGKKEEAGRPMIYGTTAHFLEFFGMKALSDLPTLKEFSELSDESKVLFERRLGERLDEGAPDPTSFQHTEEEEAELELQDDLREQATRASSAAGDAHGQVEAAAHAPEDDSLGEAHGES